jgi:hypothetical protein
MCGFCNQPCGEREFCDEACYKEYAETKAIAEAEMREEGISQFYVDDEQVFDGDF